MTAALPQAQVGVIGGSGFYELAGFTDRQEVVVETPFGSPSDALTVGQLGGMGVAFLPVTVAGTPSRPPSCRCGRTSTR